LTATLRDLKKSVAVIRTLRVVEANPRAFVGTWADVVITVWRADIELSDVQATARAQALAGGKAGPFASIAYVEPAALRVSDEARAEATRVTELGGTRLLGIGVVLPIGGFRGAIARTVATGVHMVSRSQAPQKMFEHVDEAAAWVLERLGHPLALAPTLAEAVEEARRTTG
jgi:hypothetical protein